jgi:hypothetical protein
MALWRLLHGNRGDQTANMGHGRAYADALPTSLVPLESCRTCCSCESLQPCASSRTRRQLIINDHVFSGSLTPYQSVRVVGWPRRRHTHGWCSVLRRPHAQVRIVRARSSTYALRRGGITDLFTPRNADDWDPSLAARSLQGAATRSFQFLDGRWLPLAIENGLIRPIRAQVE